MPTHPYLRRERREFIGPLVVSRRLSHAGLQKFNQSSDWLESFVNVRTSASVGRQVALFGWFFFLLLLCSSADAHMRLVADGTAATKTKPTRSFCWFIFFLLFSFFHLKPLFYGSQLTPFTGSHSRTEVLHPTHWRQQKHSKQLQTHGPRPNALIKKRKQRSTSFRVSEDRNKKTPSTESSKCMRVHAYPAHAAYATMRSVQGWKGCRARAHRPSRVYLIALRGRTQRRGMNPCIERNVLARAH